MTIDQLLAFAVHHGASDLLLQTGEVPGVRMAGAVREIEAPPLTEEQVREMVRAVAPRAVTEDLDAAVAQGSDFSYARADGSRFRCNLYSHLGTPGLVVRVVPQARTFADLHLPPVLEELARARRGLTLLSGTTGSGKSSTLAAMVDVLNSNYPIKILTIEDPVEFVHVRKKAWITHVEVGRDTPSFEHGLRQAMRQAPDVILVGELRDAETVRMALRAADTGHQVLSTVHSSNAAQTVERLLSLVPTAELSIARQQLAASLVGIVSQRLARNQQQALWPVVEILRGDAVTARNILEDKLQALADYVATGENGMQTFDAHAVELFHQGILTTEEALRVASNRDAVSLTMRLPHGSAATT